MYAKTLNVFGFAAVLMCAACAVDDSKGSTNERVRPVRQALADHIAVRLPASLAPDQVALGAFESVRVGNHATVAAEEVPASIASVGTGETRIGKDTQVGAIVSVGSVVLEKDASVVGDVTTTGEVTGLDEASVSGQTHENQNLQPFYETMIPLASVDGEGTDVALRPGARQTLEPGAWGSIKVHAGAELTLSTGVYRFDDLELKPRGSLRVNDDPGAVIVVVNDSAKLQGAIASSGGLSPELWLAVLGNARVAVRSAELGVLLVPFGTARLEGPAHRGQVFAKRIELAAHTTFAYEPSAVWWEVCDWSHSPSEFCLPPEEPARWNEALWGEALWQ